jgi:hypothetical protein
LYRANWIVRIFVILLVLTIVIAGCGQAVLHLWNWLMPNIFGLRAITFWQAVGLLGLSWVLFGGFGWLGGRPRSYMYRRMTSEERERFRSVLQERCRHGEPQTGEPKA